MKIVMNHHLSLHRNRYEQETVWTELHLVVCLELIYFVMKGLLTVIYTNVSISNVQLNSFLIDLSDVLLLALFL